MTKLGFPTLPLILLIELSVTENEWWSITSSSSTAISGFRSESIRHVVSSGGSVTWQVQDSILSRKMVRIGVAQQFLTYYLGLLHLQNCGDKQSRQHKHLWQNTLGAEGVLPRRHIESLLRVFLKITHILPNRWVLILCVSMCSSFSSIAGAVGPQERVYSDLLIQRNVSLLWT